MSGTEGITGILIAHREGQPGAFDKLVALVYPELRRIARRQLGHWRPGTTLESGSLINEAYLKLVDQTKADWHDRQHFYAIAARAMRQVIIDYARRRRRQKRGGGHEPISLDGREIAVHAQVERLLALDELLSRLQEEDPRLLLVVECRFFAGYTTLETAEALNISTRTAEREWLRAKLWLRTAMKSTGGDGRAWVPLTVTPGSYGSDAS